MASSRMAALEVIDAQVHVYDPDRHVSGSGSPFDSSLSAPLAITGAQMIDAMDAAGVDAAVLVSPSHYGWDNSYVLEVAGEHQDRFRVVGLIDHNAPDVAAQIEHWSALPQTAGVRIPITAPSHRDQLLAGSYESCLAAAERFDVPICVYAPNYHRELAELVEAHPGVRFVLDHFGLDAQVTPRVSENGDATCVRGSALRNVTSALEFATFPNVSVKLTGGPRLSDLEYPFEDLMPTVLSYIANFGPQRLMWGTDWTRVYNSTYLEGVRYLLDSNELTQGEKVAVMGGSLRALLGWT